MNRLKLGQYIAALSLLVGCGRETPSSTQVLEMSEAQTREVRHCDGLFSCRVPIDWSEEIEADGTRLLWDARGGSATLRITAITATRDGAISATPAIDLLRDSPDKPPPTMLGTGAAFRRYRKESVEDGVAIAIHWFELGHHVPPRYYRVAFFSFTVTCAEEESPQVQRQLHDLERWVRSTAFSPVALPSEL